MKTNAWTAGTPRGRRWADAAIIGTGASAHGRHRRRLARRVPGADVVFYVARIQYNAWSGYRSTLKEPTNLGSVWCSRSQLEHGSQLLYTTTRTTEIVLYLMADRSARTAQTPGSRAPGTGRPSASATHTAFTSGEIIRVNVACRPTLKADCRSGARRWPRARAAVASIRSCLGA